MSEHINGNFPIIFSDYCGFPVLSILNRHSGQIHMLYVDLITKVTLDMNGELLKRILRFIFPFKFRKRFLYFAGIDEEGDKIRSQSIARNGAEKEEKDTEENSKAKIQHEYAEDRRRVSSWTGFIFMTIFEIMLFFLLSSAMEDIGLIFVALYLYWRYWLVDYLSKRNRFKGKIFKIGWKIYF